MQSYCDADHSNFLLCFPISSIPVLSLDIWATEYFDGFILFPIKPRLSQKKFVLKLLVLHNNIHKYWYRNHYRYTMFIFEFTFSLKYSNIFF